MSEPITEAMVDRAAEAIYDAGHAYNLNRAESERLARVALDAAACTDRSE